MQKNIPDIKFNHAKGASGFEVMSLKNLFKRGETLSHKLHQPHRLKFYQMMYVSQGEGYHTVDFHSFPIKKGNLIFTSISQVQAFAKQCSYDGYVCIFTEEFLNREFLQIVDRYMVDHIYYRDITKALVLEDSSMEAYFELIQKEFVAMVASQKTGIVTSLLHSILLKSKEHFLDKTPDGESSELFDAFKKILITKYSQMRNAEEYAAILKVSPKHLNLTCKRLTGLTTKVFIDRFIILEIKRYLASSTLPIKDIASKMGYFEVSNFVKFFKKHTKLTPKSFRDSQILT